jgi:lambda repressor-like predicted transcriptional regulator
MFSSVFNPGDFSSLIDIAFVVVIAASCFFAITRSGSGGDERSAKIQADLQNLEETLRELITEAGIASNSLDRSLSRRKEELQILVERIEVLKDEVQNPPKPQRAKKKGREKRFAAEAALGQSQPLDEDVPNETWLRASPSTSISSYGPAQYANVKSLANQIEVLDVPSESVSDEQIADAREAARSIDPIALQIAKRLLKNGKEIHLVARKLELPIAQVRVIDTLLRRESGEFTPDIAQHQQIEQVEEPVEVTAERKPTRKRKRPLKADDLDDTIVLDAIER